MSFEEQTTAIEQSLKCDGCGAVLHYSPGSNELACPYCGTRNTIAAAAQEEIKSVDYAAFVAEQSAREYSREAEVVRCSNCGAATTLLPGRTADHCPFCASPLVIDLHNTRKILKPHYVLPFAIEEKAAVNNFRNWLGSLWFAPGDLLQKVKEQSAQQLKGIYIPYWSYDTDTVTSYRGLRGEYYYVTEHYTDSNRKRQTRQVRHTRWHPASGTVYCIFRDILVSASDSLPQHMANRLEPWKLDQLRSFKEQYLSGFRSETYRTEVTAALETAKQKMDPRIYSAICNDIGGDTQTVEHYESRYDNLAVKYILLPVWISAYRYNGRLYRFVVNACTGEVSGDRPWSWVKISLAVLLGLVLIGAVVYFASQT